MAHGHGVNIVWLVWDTVRLDRLSCYGYRWPTSPVLERVAHDGVMFRQAVAPACWTLPVHASFFTGLYPRQHGAIQSHPVLVNEIPTLAEKLKAAGYATLGLSNNPYVDRGTNLNRGFDVFRDWRTLSRPFWPKCIVRNVQHMRRRLGYLVPGHAAQTTVDEAIKLIGDVLQRRPQPFFLFVNLMDAHSPWHLPSRFVNQFVRKPYRKPRFAEAKFTASLAGRVKYGDSDLEAFSQHYDAAVAYLDSELGRLLLYLERSGALSNTLLCIVSDHGEHLQEHGLLGHNLSLYDSLIKVPLVMCWSGTLPRGRVVDLQVETKNLYHAFLQAAGVPADGDEQRLPGGSILEAAAGEVSSGAPFRFAFAEDADPALVRAQFERLNPSANDPRVNNCLRCVRTVSDKYIWSENGRHELYDLSSDPDETVNLFDQGHPVQLEMQEEMERWLQVTRPVVSEAAGVEQTSDEMDSDVLERLRVLGYIS